LHVVIHVALWEPEIPPNTGNIARLCAATGVTLHLVGRLGFHVDDRSLRRAGLDYWSDVKLVRHFNATDFEAAFADRRLHCFTASHGISYTQVRYQLEDCLVFGGESHGLPATFLERHAGRVVTIPMPTRKVRSLNLATSVGIAVYEAMRQLHNW
jgi:tRNA (cytidine/uridine-2'-O-)-methyltransferase